MRRLISFSSAGTVMTAVATCFLAVLAVPGWAQPPSGAPPEKHEERLEVLTMWKMMEALDLDRQTADKVIEIRHKFMAEKKAIEKELDADFGILRTRVAASSGKADDQELSRLIQGIRAKRKRLQELHDNQYTEVSKILTVRQQAQLVLFLKDFGAELRAMLRPPGGEARFGPGMGRRPPGHPGPPGRPGGMGGPPGPPGPGGPPSIPDDPDDPTGQH